MSSASTTSGRPGWLHAIATYDFSPKYSERVRRFVAHPLAILIVAGFASLLCGLFLHSQGFVLCGGVVVVIALGVIWPWLSLRGLSGVLAFDRSRASEGEAVEVQLTLRNSLPWSAWGLAVKGGFGNEPSEPVAGIASAPRRRTSLCRWAFAPAFRGVYPLSSPRLTTGFPFGLWENGRRLPVEKPLVVWPRTCPVGPIPPVSGGRQVEGNVSRSKIGTNGDMLGVRPYRRGDSPRRIHWGQSARHDRLIVCELESNSRPVIQLILDADRGVHVGTGPDSSREWAIRVVASFAKGWLEDGAQVGLAWGGHDIPPASGASQLHKILDALAGLPAEVPQPLADVLSCPKCRGFREGLQVIVTTDLRGNAECEMRNAECENLRWVILRTECGAWGGKRQSADDLHSELQTPNSTFPRPWLCLDSAEVIPALLKSGWREARHGS